MPIFAAAIAGLLALLSLAGTAVTLAAALLLRRLRAERGPVRVGDAAVTLLKPLHGAEPRLYDNLASFLVQRHFGPVQLLCGVRDRGDPAVAVVEALSRDFPAARIDLVVDATPHGSNGKVANLVNMMPHAAHDLLVLSDSDMAVPVDYLARVTAALATPGVGAVTCLYRGRGDAGWWSALCAASVSYGFLPAVLVGRALGQAQPCMGSTIALTRGALDAIGGFAAFADRLADDYAIGEAVRGLGETVAIPPMVLTHGFTERNFAELWRHELRWAATTRMLAPLGYAGSVVLQPLPLALLALPFAPTLGLALAGVAIAARLILKAAADRLAGAPTLAWWALPPRDLLSFAVFVASFGVRSVDWRGARFRMDGKGRIAAETEL